MRTKLTEELTSRMVESINGGNYLKVAARAAGVSPNTVGTWMDRGKREHERCEREGCEPDDREAVYCAFFRAISEAQAGSEEQLVGIVRNAALDSWQAAGWILERKHPERYGLSRRVKVEIETELERVLDRLKARLSPETYAAVLEALIDDDDDADEQGAGAARPGAGRGQPLALSAPGGGPGADAGGDDARAGEGRV